MTKRPRSAAPSARAKPAPVDPRAKLREPGWIWGAHAAAAVLANPAREIFEIHATRNAARDLPQDRGPLHDIAPKALSDMLPDGAVHQGVAVRCGPPPTTALDDLAARPGPLVVLDQVTDPQNVGAIIRTAAAFFAAGIVLQERKAPPLMGACAKAAVGATEVLPHARVVNVARALEALTARGRRCVGLAGEAEATLDEALADPPEAGLVLVLGSEEKGLRPGVSDACFALARIPLAAGMESLNVSVAAAVALYASARAAPT